jgi:hypothetical protein
MLTLLVPSVTQSTSLDTLHEPEHPVNASVTRSESPAGWTDWVAGVSVPLHEVGTTVALWRTVRVTLLSPFTVIWPVRSDPGFVPTTYVMVRELVPDVSDVIVIHDTSLDTFHGLAHEGLSMSAALNGPPPPATGWLSGFSV